MQIFTSFDGKLFTIESYDLVPGCPKASCKLVVFGCPSNMILKAACINCATNTTANQSTKFRIIVTVHDFFAIVIGIKANQEITLIAHSIAVAGKNTSKPVLFTSPP